jgi:hypothetical protein
MLSRRTDQHCYSFDEVCASPTRPHVADPLSAVVVNNSPLETRRTTYWKARSDEAMRQADRPRFAGFKCEALGRKTNDVHETIMDARALSLSPQDDETVREPWREYIIWLWKDLRAAFIVSGFCHWAGSALYGTCQPLPLRDPPDMRDALSLQPKRYIADLVLTLTIDIICQIYNLH